MRKTSYMNNSNRALKKCFGDDKMFTMKVSSPKYTEFARDYLDENGNVRSDICRTLMSRPNVKGCRAAYDFESKKWCIEILTNQVANVAQDPIISSLPCKIINMEGLY